MRWLAAAMVLSMASGCANTVYRIPGDARTPGGKPTTPCEEEGWLVVAPTRGEIAPEGRKTSRPVDGEGLYRVGGSSPVNVVDNEKTLGPDDTLEDRQDLLDPHDSKANIAMGLGIAGLVAIGVGTGLFVSSFETQTTTTAGGTSEEESVIDGTRAGIGGGLVGLGFALGITGLAVSPSHAERTRANAARYLFLSPKDEARFKLTLSNPERVDEMVERHNASVRERCEARGN